MERIAKYREIDQNCSRNVGGSANAIVDSRATTRAYAAATTDPSKQAAKSSQLPPQGVDRQARVAAALQAQGQLAPVHALDCVPIQSVHNDYTPPDLYASARKCVEKGLFENSAAIFALAGTYGRFDIERITDKSVSGGLTILIMHFGDGLTEAHKQGFSAAVSLLHDNPSQHAAFCAQVAKIGPPDYTPMYLISHGMGIGDGRRSDGNGLAVDFNGNAVWSTLLKDGLLCPAKPVPGRR